MRVGQLLFLALPSCLHSFVLMPSHVSHMSLPSSAHLLQGRVALSARFPAISLRPRSHEMLSLRSSQGDSNEVADGVQLPVDDIDFKKQKAWVADEIAIWLDKEWVPRDIHREIGEVAGSVVLAARENGMHDCTGILFEVASKLETFDFYEADVNNWDIANKVSDLLLQSTGKDVCCTSPPETTPDFSKASESSAALCQHPESGLDISLPSDPFEKYQFLQQALDGRVGQCVINHAVLLSLGFEAVPDPAKGELSYTAAGVSDSRWERLDPRPDFFAGMEAIELLDARLQEELTEENKREEELDALIEALHGEAAVRIAREGGDEDFLRRETCVKWLHFVGGY